VNMPYGLVNINGHVSYVFDSISNSKFVCAEAQTDTFYDPLKKMVKCNVPRDTISIHHIPNEYTFCNIKSHSTKTHNVQCTCILCIRQPPTLKGLCLQALEHTASD